MPPGLGGIFFLIAKLLIFAFALLVCHAAAGLAGRLAGSLAFAATAVIGAELTGLQRSDMFHKGKPPKKILSL